MPSFNRPTRCLLGALAASAGYGEAFATVNRQSISVVANRHAHASCYTQRRAAEFRDRARQFVEKTRDKGEFDELLAKLRARAARRWGR